MIGIGVIVLSELWGSEEALGVGDTPGEEGPLPTLSLEVRLGDSLAGKLRVFVHCDKLRTILTVHKHNTRSLNSLWWATRALANTVRGRMRNRRGQQNVQRYSLCKLRLDRLEGSVCRVAMCASMQFGVRPPATYALGRIFFCLWKGFGYLVAQKSFDRSSLGCNELAVNLQFVVLI